MNYRKLLVLSLVALIQFPVFSQKKQKVNPKHVNYYRNVTNEDKNLKVEIQDAVSMIEFSKFKLKLTNKTTDFILFKPKESTFRLDIGDFVPQDKKTIIIPPMEKDSKVLDIKGAGQNVHVDNYKFQLDGLYKVTTNPKSTEAPNFLLPPSTNDFTAGNFKVEMLKIAKTTQETAVKFKVTYLGDGAGLIDPKKISVKIESGQLFATERKDKTILLTKGESDTFVVTFNIEGKIVDMQFANMELVWKDTFKDCEITKIDGSMLDLVLDPGMTAGKNK